MDFCSLSYKSDLRNIQLDRSVLVCQTVPTVSPQILWVGTDAITLSVNNLAISLFKNSKGDIQQLLFPLFLARPSKAMSTSSHSPEHKDTTDQASSSQKGLSSYKPTSRQQLMRTDSKRGRLQDLKKAGVELDEIDEEPHSYSGEPETSSPKPLKVLSPKPHQNLFAQSLHSPQSDTPPVYNNPFVRKILAASEEFPVSPNAMPSLQSSPKLMPRESMPSDNDPVSPANIFPTDFVDFIYDMVNSEEKYQNGGTGAAGGPSRQRRASEEQTEAERAFYKVLFKQLGEYLYKLSDSMLESLSGRNITYEELKTEYCWNVLGFMLDVCRAHDMSSTHNSVRERSHMMTKFNLEMRRAFQFLELKFAPLKNMGSVDCNILSRICDVNKKYDVRYDMLTNSGMGSEHWSGKQDYSAQIKLFINLLIRESRKQYPAFMQTMQQLMENDFDDEFEENTCKMEIEAPLMDSTELYTEEQIKAPGLKPKSGELLRVITFWTNELYSNFGASEEMIVNRVGGFKSCVRGQGFALTKKRRTTLANHLKDIFRTKIQHLKEQREEVLNGLLVDLLSGILKGYRGHQGLNSKQVMIAKLSQYLYECLQADLCIAINEKITMLNLVRECYESEFLEHNIDLVTFGLMDLLKCKITGNKAEINRAYKRIVANKDYYEIIELENRLGTSHSDLLMHLKLENSFLVCEVQLVLADTSTFTENSSSKNTSLNNLSRLLHDLRTSRFPVAYECASTLIQLDPSINYFDKQHPVEFRGYVLDYSLLEFRDATLFCTNKHAKKRMDYISSRMPFWCKACKVFFEVYTFGPEFLRCSECLLTICPKCMLDRWSQFQQVFIQKYCNSSFMAEFLEPAPLLYGFYSNSELEEKVRQLMPANGYTLVQQYDCHHVKVRILRLFGDRLIDGFLTLRNLPKARVTDSRYNWCTLLSLRNVKRLKLSALEYHKKVQIGKPWYDVEEIFEEERVQEVMGCSGRGKVVLLVDLVEDAEAIEKTIAQNELEEMLARENTKEEIFLELSSRNIVNLNTINEKITNKQNVKLINLWENNIYDISSLTQYPNLNELSLRENYVTDILPLLKLTNLLHLNLQRNNLIGSFPEISFPLLKSLDISCNRLTDVSALGRSTLTSLTLLLIGVNNLEALPVLDCPNLDTLYFQLNSITSLDNLQRSTLPSLQSIHGCKNRLRGKLPKLTFPNLRDLWLHDNFIEDLSEFAGHTLENFEWLRVTNNCVKGEIPVFELPSLCNLELENNQLTGMKNMEKWKTPALQIAVLGSNRISGALPLLNFSQLKLLNLSRNTLSSIDNIMHCSINQIEQLDLSYNQIFGALPVLKFPRLSRLCFEMNRFDDARPLEHCILPSLEFLDISLNHIRTSVPILQFENLKEIRITENAIRSLHFLKEAQLVPQLKAIIVHPSELVLLPQEETKLRTYRMRDALLEKRKAMERKRMRVQRV